MTGTSDPGRTRLRTWKLPSAWTVTLFVAACSGSQTTAQRETVPPEQGMQSGVEQSFENDAASTSRSAAGSPDLQARRLLTDIIGHRACDFLKGKFLPLMTSVSQSSNQQKADEATAERVTGRLWIRECTEEPAGDDARIRFEALAWRWVDRSTSQLGAEFTVEQYVPLRIDRSPTFWGDLLGEVTDLFTQGPQGRATERLEQRATTRFQEQLSSPLTVAVDLRTMETYTRLVELEAGVLPDVPFSKPNQRSLANARVELHAGGIDVAGPFSSTEPLHAVVRATEGSPVRAALLCQSEADRVASAFLHDQPLPHFSAHAEAVVGVGETRELRASAECPLALLTQRASGESGDSVLLYRMFKEGDSAQPIVECKGRHLGVHGLAPLDVE